MPFVQRIIDIAFELFMAVWDAAIIMTLTGYYVAESVFLFFIPTFMRSQKSLKGKVVVITGGAGGIGQELAMRLGKQKAKVVIWDINEKALAKTKKALTDQGCEVHSYAVDVTDRKNVYKNAELVKEELGPVDILINNAGIVCGNTFMELPDAMIEKTFQVNILSHYWTTKAFLGDMIKTGSGHIVTVGSLTGMLGTYKCVDYSATKHATMGFHESLLTELKTHGHHNIHMTLICPYFINTGMFAGCKPKNFPMLEPRDVARRIVTAIRLEEVFVTMPGWARFFIPLKNFTPAKLNWAMMHRIIKGPQSMKDLRQYKDVAAA